MSEWYRKTVSIIGAVVMLLALAFCGFMASLQTFGEPFFTLIPVFVFIFALLGLQVFARRSSSREAEVAELVADSTPAPFYYEEAKPEEVESETPMVSCPDCGYENPGDADFCIRCGRDLDIKDDTARYL
ncbi:MAG: zinc-ribbon domain-containing protein [Promethearchaeota archaeon]